MTTEVAIEQQTIENISEKQSPSKRKRPANCRIDLGELTHHNIKQLKLINQAVFPVSYNDKFYRDVLEVGELAKLAYCNDVVVGAVCCRVDVAPDAASTGPATRKLYIMTLGCLAPYRRLGIGSLMLEHVLKIAEKDASLESIYLHVQVNNDAALDFYKRFQFEIVEKKENYYKRIFPQDAYVLEKRLKEVKTNGEVTSKIELDQ